MALTHTEAAAAAAEAPAAADTQLAAAVEDDQAAAAAADDQAAAAVEAPAAAEGDQATAAAENEQAEAESLPVVSTLLSMDIDMGSEGEHDEPAAAEGEQAQPAAVAGVESAVPEVGQPAERGSGRSHGLGNDASMAAETNGDSGDDAVDGSLDRLLLQASISRVEAMEGRLAELEARAMAQGGTAVAQSAVQTAVAADSAGTSSRSSNAAEHPVVLQLPRAHTCFLQLLLPVGYQNAAEMRRALLVALENVDYFGTA